jgi:hypothetical protein
LNPRPPDPQEEVAQFVSAARTFTNLCFETWGPDAKRRGHRIHVRKEDYENVKIQWDELCRKAENLENSFDWFIQSRESDSYMPTSTPKGTVNFDPANALTNKQAAQLYMDEMEGRVKFPTAKAKISKACAKDEIRSNGQSGPSRRIDRESLRSWILDLRNKALDDEDQGLQEGREP